MTSGARAHNSQTHIAINMKQYLVKTAEIRAQIIPAETIREVDEHMRAVRSAYKDSNREFLLLSIEEVVPAEPLEPQVA